MSGVAERIAELREGRSDLVRRVFRYGAGSVVATVCSQTTFLLVYGPLGASTTVASTLAWLAGAIPNYWMNRSWTWGRRGRPSLTRELLPYAAIIFGTLGLAILATGVGAALLGHTGVSRTTRTFLVWAIYFLVYVVMFAFRFLLFDRLFRPQEAVAEPR
ncbi:MAG TPA: GtrA family protein [Nocardioides sp.]|jgi:putative flippase GtrA|nr:GtrA family protein [Nocardioides sp.]